MTLRWPIPMWFQWRSRSEWWVRPHCDDYGIYAPRDGTWRHGSGQLWRIRFAW